MGTWKIEIVGTGCHHNGERADEVGDADHLATELVAALKAKGTVVHSAKFAHGGFDYVAGEVGAFVVSTYVEPEDLLKRKRLDAQADCG